jgi:hypothetical protein
MKTKILKGIVMMSAVVLGACTTTKYAAQQKDYNDDVYYSKAKAGDAVEYASNNRSYRNDGYYDNYSSRISRFGGYSPFAYDGFYNSYYGAGLGLGLGYGLGSYYGYSPYSMYSPYSYYGSGYGLGYGGYGYGIGGSPYWGLYSGYTSVNTNYGARPGRGNGNPGATYNSTLRGTSVISGRGYNPGVGVSNSGNTYNNNGGYSQRPTRQAAPQIERSYPTYNTPAPSSMGGGFGGGGGRISSGGARPGRG